MQRKSPIYELMRFLNGTCEMKTINALYGEETFDIEADIWETENIMKEIPEEHWCVYEQLYAQWMGWA